MYFGPAVSRLGFWMLERTSTEFFNPLTVTNVFRQSKLQRVVLKILEVWLEGAQVPCPGEDRKAFPGHILAVQGEVEIFFS